MSLWVSVVEYLQAKIKNEGEVSLPIDVNECRQLQLCEYSFVCSW